MIKKILPILFLLFSISSQAQQQLRFEIKSFPKSISMDSAVFLAGNFNNWNPNDDHYKFRNDGQGNYFLEISLKPDWYEYKLTRGSWIKVECKKDGSAIENRSLKVEKSSTIFLTIDAWADQFKLDSKKNSASKNVSIMDTAFFIPQLNRYRRVWIYLPETYAASSKKYPVLYIHDGQNVFEDSSSYAGEWGVDEALDSLGKQTKESIVVAIDNGMKFRLNEYSPYNMEQYGKGEGDLYVDFLVKTLKPFIDKHYRTKSNKKNTSIAGSSMGGLISMYAVMKYPTTFGTAGVFSPSFWISPKLKEDLLKKGKSIHSKIYFYMGEAEGESMINPMKDFVDQLKKTSNSKIISVIIKDAKHNESAWRKEFPNFYKWIMKK